MSAIGAYFDNLRAVLDAAEQTQTEALEQGARLMADATLSGHNIFAFGCSHAGLLALEMYYRTGGMATINPVRAPGLPVHPAQIKGQYEIKRYHRQQRFDDVVHTLQYTTSAAFYVSRCRPFSCSLR